MKNEQITIPKSVALSILSQLEEHVKPLLADLLKTPTKWQDIQSFEDACLVAPPHQEDWMLLNYSGLSEDLLALRAEFRIIVIARAVNFLANGNKEWIPDFSNNTPKYAAWLKYEPGSGLSDDDYFVFWHSDSIISSRLLFISEEVLKHVAKVVAAKEYNEYFTLTPTLNK